MTVRITTDRLILRELELSDTNRFYEMEMDPLVRATLLGLDPPSSLDDTKAIIQGIIGQYHDTGVGRLAVVEKASGEFIGWAGLKLERNVNNHDIFYDLGYRLMSRYWDKGYASEAARAVVAYGFETLKVDKICAYVEQGNDSSRRVAENAGLRVISTFAGDRVEEWWLELEKNRYTELINMATS